MAGPAAEKSSFVKPRSDERLSAADHALAGSLAKAATKLFLYPLDTWKSRRQARRFGSLDEFRHLWTLKGVYRGVVPKLVLYTPYQAVYMGAYVVARDRLVEGPVPFGPGSALTFMTAGVAAELAASVIRLPMEVSKLRLQLGIYQNTWHALKDCVRNPGRLYYGSFLPQTLLHDCSYSACAWLVFETSRQRLFAHRGSSELPAHESLALGVFTGTLSALATNPFDVVKTRIIGRPQGSDCGSSAGSEGVASTVFKIWREEGPRVFWRGAMLRVMHLAPSHGLYMLLYELVKMQLAAWRGHFS